MVAVLGRWDADADSEHDLGRYDATSSDDSSGGSDSSG